MAARLEVAETVRISHWLRACHTEAFRDGRMINCPSVFCDKPL